MHIPEMAEAASKMVTESINAFVRGDVELARQVICNDDIVDNLFNRIKTNLAVLSVRSRRSGSRLLIS